MMKLIDLDPKWVRYAADEDSFVEVPAQSLGVPDAAGIRFLCPTCFTRNGGAIGTESVLCWFSGRGVPDAALPGPGRWTPSGTSFADLSLSPSVNVAHGHWHGFIRNGEIA